MSCGKDEYYSEDQIKLVIKNIISTKKFEKRGTPNLGYYKCDACGKWHLCNKDKVNVA